MMSEIRESDVLLIDKLDVGQEVQVLDKASNFYVPGKGLKGSIPNLVRWCNDKSSLSFPDWIYL